MDNEFDLIDASVTPDKFIYARELGWDEKDDDGELIPVMIIVVDANLGYNVLRLAYFCELLEWFSDREDAIDYAVDSCRMEISKHEYDEFTKD